MSSDHSLRLNAPGNTVKPFRKIGAVVKNHGSACYILHAHVTSFLI